MRPAQGWDMMPADDADGHITEGTDRRIGGPRTVAALLPRVTSTALRRRGFVQASVVHEWAGLVGEQVADWCRPDRLVFPRGERQGATLTLIADSARAVELQHLAPMLVERINMVFGFAAVARIAIRQGRVSRPQARRSRLKPLSETEAHRLARRLDGIAAEPLRDALERLGRAVLAGPRDGSRDASG